MFSKLCAIMTHTLQQKLMRTSSRVSHRAKIQSRCAQTETSQESPFVANNPDHERWQDKFPSAVLSGDNTRLQPLACDCIALLTQQRAIARKFRKGFSNEGPCNSIFELPSEDLRRFVCGCTTPRPVQDRQQAKHKPGANRQPTDHARGHGPCKVYQGSKSVMMCMSFR